MKIKLQIFNNLNGPDFFFSAKDVLNLHIFNTYSSEIQNYRFDIPHPIYYQQTNFSLRQCFREAVEIRRNIRDMKIKPNLERWVHA